MTDNYSKRDGRKTDTLELVTQIKEEKLRRKAIILAHNYTLPEVQNIADITGDSLGLSQAASETQAEVIVFCGVHFMAETASLLCPGRIVLTPDQHAGCPMANMITPRELQMTIDSIVNSSKDCLLTSDNNNCDSQSKVKNSVKMSHLCKFIQTDTRETTSKTKPTVVTYINSTAAVKALSDICVTSANAVAIVAAIPPDETILFTPDRNLGQYVQKQTGRDMYIWNGFCPTHERITPEFIQIAREKHPDAVLVVHPECRPAVVALADKVASTTGILKYCQESTAREFIIGTENALLYRLQRENPNKLFYPASELADCPNMKLATLEKILWCLQDLEPQVTVKPELAAAARRPIDKMLEMSKKLPKN